MGEGSHYRLPPEESAGRVSAADLHDAGCRCGGGEPGPCVAGAATSRTVVAMEKQTVTQGDRLRAAAAAASTLAHRCFLHQRVRHVLLLVQRAGGIQSFPRALGSAGIYAGSRHRNHSRTALGEVLFFVEGGRIEGERIYEALRSLEQCLLAHQFGLPLKSWSHLRVLVEKALKNGVIDRVRAKENYPEAKPRIISDNGPQFIARDFKEFIRISGMTHVRT